MIMKKILLLALPLMVMCFASCEKDKGNNDVDFGQKLVKEITLLGDGYTESWAYEYDAQNRIVKVLETYSESDYYEKVEHTVEYEGNTIIIASYDALDGNMELYAKEKYSLDNNGYVEKVEFTYAYQDPHTCFYNYENGLLKSMEVKHYFSDGSLSSENEYEYNWVNDDIVCKNSLKYSSKVDVQYYFDVENRMNINVFNVLSTSMDNSDNSVIKFKGTYSEHLPKSKNYNNSSTSYSYEFDTEGYPIKWIEEVKSVSGELFTSEYDIKYY